MTQEEINDQEWHKAENWTSGSKFLCVYFSHADSRSVVSKRNPAHGWTLNLAKKKGVAGLLACILGPLTLVILIFGLVLMLTLKL